jgi:endonuclease G, mitochondrial
MIYEDLLKDKELTQEVLDKINTNPIFDKLNLDTAKAQDYLKISEEKSPTEARTELSLSLEESLILEAIIEEQGYPSLLIRNNTYEVSNSDLWASRLNPYKHRINKFITSVGRIEVANDPQGILFLGTGWLVSEDIIVTNRHVARQFAELKQGEFVFKTFRDENLEIEIDFREEYKNHAKEEFIIQKVLYIEPGDNPETSPDLAFLKVSRQRFDGTNLISLSSAPLMLATELPEDESEIVVIGYPWEDPKRLDFSGEVIQAIFNDIYNVKRLQPGNIKSVEANLLTHNSSTLRGNSGSAVVDFKTGKAVGLHWGGRNKIANYAIPAMIVEQRLNDLLSGKLKVTSIAESTIVIFSSPIDLEAVDNETPIEFDDTPCFCPLNDEKLENLILEAVPFPEVNTQLPISGTGYYSYALFREKQFGLPETIKALEEIGKMWFKNHRTGPLIGIGNISKNGGGPVPPHTSHQTGLDVDFRLLRSDGARIGITFRDPNYSLNRNQDLINTILNNSVLSVQLILCNDNNLKGVQPWPGHDDHLHVRFIK